MISSVIKPTIKYEENTTIDLLDKNNHFEVYEHVLCGIDVELCIGNINNINKIHNVLFCPVYLVKTNNSVIKIGIIEFTPIQMSYIFDENNDIDLDNVQILLYSFVTPQYINIITGNDNMEQSEDEEEPEQKSNTKSPQNTKLHETVVNTPPSPETNINHNMDSKKSTKNNNNKKAILNITEINEIKLNINGMSNKSRKNRNK